jgi:hypothetical protein
MLYKISVTITKLSLIFVFGSLLGWLVFQISILFVY